jgi:hypothetical protein
MMSISSRTETARFGDKPLDLDQTSVDRRIIFTYSLNCFVPYVAYHPFTTVLLRGETCIPRPKIRMKPFFEALDKALATGAMKKGARMG